MSTPETDYDASSEFDPETANGTTVATEVATATTDGDERERRGRRGITSERAALWVFLAYLVVALPLLIKFGSYRWFLGDEWTFLSTRSVRNFDDWVRPHNQHWSTVPFLLNRGLYAIWGLRAYLPYQLPVILLHLTTAGLVRVVMRRSGVGPWLATAAAGMFVLFGPGQDNILWAFQVGFAGTMVLGLAQLILANHDGPIDRRDWLGLAAGAVALITSGQAPSLILATGLAVVIRQGWKSGWRRAALHTVPLGIAYVIWYFAADASLHTTIDEHGGLNLPPFTLSEYVHWMQTAAIGLFESLGYFRVIALGLAAMLVIGWIVAWRTLDRLTFRRQAAMPGALVIGLLISISVAASERFFLGPNEARASRYVGVMAVMTLPALALAGNALMKRWRLVTPLVFALFLIPIPWNINLFTQDDPVFSPAYYNSLRAFISSLPDYPGVSAAPRWISPDPSLLGQPGMTLGWLLDAKRAGKLPPATPMSPGAATQIPVRLDVAVKQEPDPTGKNCQVHTSGVTLQTRLGDQWVLKTPVYISTAKGTRRTSFPVAFSASALQNVVEIEAPDVQLLVEPPPGQGSFELCT